MNSQQIERVVPCQLPVPHSLEVMRNVDLMGEEGGEEAAEVAGVDVVEVKAVEEKAAREIGHGRTRTRQAGLTIIGRGDMIKRWPEQEVPAEHSCNVSHLLRVMCDAYFYAIPRI